MYRCELYFSIIVLQYWWDPMLVEWNILERLWWITMLYENDFTGKISYFSYIFTLLAVGHRHTFSRPCIYILIIKSRTLSYSLNQNVLKWKSLLLTLFSFSIYSRLVCVCIKHCSCKIYYVLFYNYWLFRIDFHNFPQLLLWLIKQ